jgi:hypothetical protein
MMLYDKVTGAQTLRHLYRKVVLTHDELNAVANSCFIYHPENMRLWKTCWWTVRLQVRHLRQVVESSFQKLPLHASCRACFMQTTDINQVDIMQSFGLVCLSSVKGFSSSGSDCTRVLR